MYTRLYRVCAEGWCKHFPTLPLAVLLLSNKLAPLLRSRLILLCQATFSFVVVGVGSFFDWFIMIQLLKLASNELIRLRVKLQTFRALTLCQTKSYPFFDSAILRPSTTVEMQFCL